MSHHGPASGPYLPPGTHVRFGDHDREWEDGIVVHCWNDDEIGGYDCYVAFFGHGLPSGRPLEKPYILRYAASSLTVVQD